MPSATLFFDQNGVVITWRIAAESEAEQRTVEAALKRLGIGAQPEQGTENG